MAQMSFLTVWVSMDSLPKMAYWVPPKECRHPTKGPLSLSHGYPGFAG